MTTFFVSKVSGGGKGTVGMPGPDGGVGVWLAAMNEPLKPKTQ